MEYMFNSFINAVGIWGYVILFLYSIGGGFIALLVASILSSSIIENNLNIFIVIFVSFLANFIGSSLIFYIAKYQKRDFLKYFKKHKRKLALSYLWIRKYNIWIIFIHKYLYGIKTIVPIAIGLSNYNTKKFLFLNILSSILWASSIGLLGLLGGDSIKKLYINNANIFPFIGLILFVLIVILLSKLTKH